MTQYDNKNITANIGQCSLWPFMKTLGRQDDKDRIKEDPLLFVSIYPITDEDILMIGGQSVNCSWVLAWCGFSWVVSPTDPSVAHGHGAVVAKAVI